MIAVGDEATLSRLITEADVEEFALLTGDTNPVHLNAQYAAGTRFKRPIVHGMFTAALVSRVLGTKLPGPGAIYLSQGLRFRAPVYPGDTLTTTVRVVEVRADKPIVTLSTVVTNQDGTAVLDGEATLLVEASGATE